jgi:dUTP pyrophosphatase
LSACSEVILPAKQAAAIPTGIVVLLPPDTYGRIASRSGLSLENIDVSAGVIDRGKYI